MPGLEDFLGNEADNYNWDVDPTGQGAPVFRSKELPNEANYANQAPVSMPSGLQTLLGERGQGMPPALAATMPQQSGVRMPQTPLTAPPQMNMQPDLGVFAKSMGGIEQGTAQMNAQAQPQAEGLNQGRIAEMAQAIASKMDPKVRQYMSLPNTPQQNTEGGNAPVNKQFEPMFNKIGKQFGVSPQLLNNVAKVESSFNPNAKAGISSAGGLFQFIDGTWERYKPRLKKAGYSTNKFDPEANTAAAAMYFNDNKKYLERKLGREPTGTELYIAHNLGAGGASTLLRKGPAGLPSRVKKNNPLFFRGSNSLDDVLNKYEEHIGLGSI